MTKSFSFDRREFLELAVLGSTGLLVRERSFGNVHGSERRVPEYAQFCSLAPGAVRPEGWLRLYLQKQSRQLASQLSSVSWPFTEPYWAGEEETNADAWWPWEQTAYWVDGALRCALVLKDESLLDQALKPVDYTLNHANLDGYLGPNYLRDPKAKGRPLDDFRWPHSVFFRALAAQGEANGDLRIPAAIRRHYLAERKTSFYEGASLNITNVEGMLWAYQHTGDAELLAMAKRAWNTYLVSFPPGDRRSCDLHPERVLAGTRIRAHGVTYAEKAKLPAILYLHSSDPNYLRYAVAAQERMFTHHMLIDGLPSSAEEFRGIDSLDAHETCNISGMTCGWGYVLMATGDGIWADRIERAIFNAGFGSIKKDWKALQYFSSPNQVISTEYSSHVPYGYANFSEGFMAFRPNPGHSVACCAGNAMRFMPNYAIRMWMSDGRGGLVAVLYGPSIVRAAAGPSGATVEIHQETDYPFGDQIHFKIESQQPIHFPLSLRIPGWCTAPELMLNGSRLDLPKIQKGFIRIERRFLPGDRITLKLPMGTVVSFWPQTWSMTSMGFEHGPLVFAMDIKPEWNSTVTPKYSTLDFPEWNASPVSAWNYGIATDGDEPLKQPMFEQLEMTDDPWMNPPVRLVVPMKNIPGWSLRLDPVHPEMKMTPPQPGTDEPSGSEVESVALVPFGATHLRLSIFPPA